MSKKKKFESKKERKRRIKKNRDSFYARHNKKETDMSFPQTIEEAVKMGILK